LPPQPWEFRSKPAYQRLIIMLGGVTVNFILALLFISDFAYGDTYVASTDFKDGMLIENPAKLVLKLVTSLLLMVIPSRGFDMTLT
jgi:regulator of sigma E protease